GDGGSATGATATHPYTAAGTYVVTLTVTDDKGATNVAASSVTVATTPGGGDPQPQPLADDSFDRSVSGGWGQATVGGSWKVSGGSASVASVAAGVGRLSLPAGSTRYVTLDETPLSDGTVTTQFTMSPAAATGASYIGVVARQTSADRYMVRAWMRADGTVWLVASRGATVLGSQPLSGVTAVPDTSYSLTVSVTGGTTPSLSAKLWATGAAEPANWQLVAADGSGSPLSAGAFGVVAYRVSSATAPLAVAFDSFRVASAQ
uniref:PKD domain-containing protein n=1 Tax=unclassified Microbacterium TaxID=2609290 RepID=UPI00301808B7